MSVNWIHSRQYYWSISWELDQAPEVKESNQCFPSVHTGWWVNCQVENVCVFLSRNLHPILSYNFQVFFTLTLSICMMVASNSSTRSSSVSCFISRKYLRILNYSSVDCIFTTSETTLLSQAWENGQMLWMLNRWLELFSLFLVMWFLKKLTDPQNSTYTGGCAR